MGLMFFRQIRLIMPNRQRALAYATVSSPADGLRRIVTHRGALIALGELSLEIWEDAGTTPFAFAPIRADVDIGCIAEQTVATVADALLWVDHNGWLASFWLPSRSAFRRMHSTRHIGPDMGRAKGV